MREFLLSRFCSVACVVTAAFAVGVAAEQKTLFIFETPATFEIHLTLQETQLSTQDIFYVEEAATSYFRDLITQDESLRFLDDPVNVLSVDVDIEKQTIDENNAVLTGKVQMMHYGDQGIIDLAALLTFLVNKNNTDSNYVYIDQLIGTGATVESVDFFFVSESVPQAFNLTATVDAGSTATSSSRPSSETTLIVVVTLLSITLLGLSAVLCWIGGGWLALRRQVKILLLREEELTRMTQQNNGIQTKTTHETDDEGDGSPSRDTQTNFTNASGILGVYGLNGYGSNKLQSLSIKTPGPSKNDDLINDDDLATPMSTYSDTNRAPIGIMSMRRLVGSNSLMHVNGDDSDHSDEEENHAQDNVDVENLGMKKLEY